MGSAQLCVSPGCLGCCQQCPARCCCSPSALPAGDVIQVYYGDNRFGTVTDSGTATLKSRPGVRPLLTFLPLVSAPTPELLLSAKGEQK